jgi:triosephosphate isomerase
MSDEDSMRPLIAGNWKMHGRQGQLGEIAALAASAQTRRPGVDILICPPATLIERAVRVADGLISIGGQDCHWDVSGPYTGDVSAEMLRDDGASAVIVGHSERRQHHCETNAIVAAKAKAAQRAGLMAIICIGETDKERQAGSALSTCADQIAGSVPSSATALSIAIAYEPLWAIGAGGTAKADEIVEMHAHIRYVLSRQLGAEGGKIRILYGGSVNAGNAAQTLALPNVDGALVGRASLDANDFAAVVQSASAASAALSVAGR